MKWSDEQQAVINKLIDFIDNDELVLVLSGNAGTGNIL